jgi:putative redox protein
VGERHGIDLSRATVKVVKHMVADPKRRIGRLEVEVRVPGLEDPAHRERLERAALTCPVHATLGDRVEMPVSFVWDA